MTSARWQSTGKWIHGCGWLLLLTFVLWAPALRAQHAHAAAYTGSTIVRNPSDLPAPLAEQPLANLPPHNVVRVLLTAQEVTALLDPATGVSYHYWTFNGKVPGPFVRVRVGDTVIVTLRNNADDRMAHSVDFHASIGPGGGAAMMQVPPGQERTFSFVATTPGLFVYHCGTPMVAEHIANGMYGLILVEPRGGLPHVDHEYYIMQGEIYTSGPGKRGQTLSFDEKTMMAERPQYFVFNGAVDSLTKQYPMHASVGQTVRIFFGNAGPNDTSSPHLIGEIFSRDYAFGSLLSPPLLGVQTATVPPGDAAIFEVKVRMPGQFVFVDHAMARMEQGLVADLDVTGRDVAELMRPGSSDRSGPIPPLAMTAEDSAEALLADVSATPEPAPTAEPVELRAVATTTVTMTDSSFVPPVITITAGQAVTWSNTSSALHTVVDDSTRALNPGDVALPIGADAFASPFLLSGQTYTHVFTTPGVYRYVCTQHEHNGMIGTVIVNPAGRRVASTTHRRP
ncbi:MAG: multicopper oxidase domain-containing protein [Terriglobales bacterium]